MPSPLSPHVAHVCACRGPAPLGGPVAKERQAGSSAADGADGGDGHASGDAGACSPGSPASPPVTASTDWYALGQSRTVVVGGVEVTVRFVGRKGRRARISITA